MRDSRGLSQHEEMRDILLPAWGRQGRINPDKPDNERGASSIYNRGKKDETERDDDAAPEALPYKLPEEHWEAIDFAIKQLSELHRAIIRDKFYRRMAVNILDTDAAVRALLDIQRSNRSVVDIMKRMGWT